MSFINFGPRSILSGGMTLHPSGTKGRIDLSRSTPLPANTDGGVIKAGTSAARVTSDTASMKFVSTYFDSTATTGSVEGFYTRTYLSGASGGGNALRAFCTVNDVAVSSAARGAHISLSQGATGSVTGLGAALEATLHINASGTAAGSLYGIKSAINSDAATSDPVGATVLAYFAAHNQGNATGMADVDDDAQLLDIQGHTIGAGNMVFASATLAATHVIKIKVGATQLYLLATDTPA